ncbi:hypothetical protein DFJ73DRAFT_851353 [Zopfochytrium polystomum]|nr:hypothetical protein DFJ73DRAFT_885255 [Zopfochytrium polystomum]KAI9327317.1 hypothetical protein DFJ73DRAFT_863987 [Zopfochytrium polystomum]KAI9327467.1 hypothetical protein DFJ73DRAFT_863632 [Zopfochytrium polystomum]KAI9335858.1 hypothetical protein DFJ73DRAFT_851353 [Zopfochytrium polystomum]
MSWLVRYYVVVWSLWYSSLSLVMVPLAFGGPGSLGSDPLPFMLIPVVVFGVFLVCGSGY